MLCKFSIAEMPALLDHVVDGTPFVPFAVMVNLLAQAVKLEDSEALLNCKIDMPIMLRKNRDRELIVVANETEASLQDKTGNVYASLSKDKNSNVHLNTVHKVLDSKNLKQILKQIEPSQIYPDIFFHGPTFQGSFGLCAFDKNQAMIKISSFETKPISLGNLAANQKIPIVFTDLVLQVVGLHFLAMNQTYGLPISCSELYYDLCTENDVFLTTEAYVTTSCQTDGTYNVSVENMCGNEILKCKGVKFQAINRIVQPSILKKIEALFLNNDLAKKEDF